MWLSASSGDAFTKRHYHLVPFFFPRDRGGPAEIMIALPREKNEKEQGVALIYVIETEELKNTTIRERTTNFLALLSGERDGGLYCTLTAGRAHGTPLWNDVWLFYTVARAPRSYTVAFSKIIRLRNLTWIFFFFNQWRIYYIFIRYVMDI